MIFSYRRLIKEANLQNVSINDIAKAINSIGFEVEEIKKFNEVEGIKFGHVLKIYKNPNAERLSVCEIEVANGETKIIQTTATNVKQDDYLMIFPIGSKSKNVTFSARVMQGIESQGMLVGLSEVGFDENIIPQEFQDQIFTFKKVDLNLDPLEYFELNDYLIDVTILSNRADATCYLIMAKELGAYFNSKPLKLKENKATLKSSLNVYDKLIDTNYLSLVETSDLINLSIQDKMLLWKHGIRTDDSGLDLASLTLLYAGVPCFAYNNLISNEISTENYSKKVTLNNNLQNIEVELENNLVVKNGNKVLSLASVAPLKDAFEKNAKGNTIFELSSFGINKVRKSAKQAKFETLASLRGQKEIAPGQIILAYHFLSTYLINFSTLINKPKIKNQSIFLDKKIIDKYAAFSITRTKKFSDVINKLEILGFEYNKKLNDLKVPSYRYDIFSYQDLIEEIFRFYGYDNFVSKQIPITVTSENLENVNPNEKILESFKDKNYMNVRTFSLIKPEENIFNPFNFTNTLVANDSKNYDHSSLRNSMIVSLNNVLVHNKKQNINNISIFEIGMINNMPNVLGIASNEKTFEEMKRDILSLTNKSLVFKKSNNIMFHKNVSADIYLEDIYIGYLAKLNPNVLKSNAIFSEILLDKLTNKKHQYVPYNKNQLKSRDITFTLNKNESIEAKLNEINKLKGIYEISIKDVFEKDNNTKNVTISIVLESWAADFFDKVFNK